MPDTPRPMSRRAFIEASYDFDIPKHLKDRMYTDWGAVEYRPGFAEPVPANMQQIARAAE